MRAALIGLFLLAGCGGGGGDPPSEVIVDMHFGALKGTGWMPADPGGIVPYPLAVRSPAGSQQLTMVGAVPAVGQLITLKAIDGEYYSAVVQTVSGRTVTLKAPLTVAVDQNQNCWNAYDNENHPNEPGYYMVIDHALRTMPMLPGFTTGRHVMIGDSWFEIPIFEVGLRQRLPSATIINKGIGGSLTENLVARFTVDVTPEQPNFVWIMVGSNDYYAGVPATDYAARIARLVAMTKEIGAVPIVFTSSVGSKDFAPDRFALSREYAAAVHP